MLGRARASDAEATQTQLRGQLVDRLPRSSFAIAIDARWLQQLQFQMHTA